MLCVGCLLHDWLLTYSLTVIQSSSLRETGMIIAFTSAVLHYMLTEVIITHANCTVKEKKNISRRHFEIFFLCFQKTVFDVLCKLFP